MLFPSAANSVGERGKKGASSKKRSSGGGRAGGGGEWGGKLVVDCILGGEMGWARGAEGLLLALMQRPAVVPPIAKQSSAGDP